MEPIFNVRQQSEIYIGPTSDILPGVLPGGRVVVVSDATIDRLYHPMLAPYDTVLIGLGESIKTLQTVESIYRRFIELGVDRSTFVLGIGGGIVTDVAGFAAATYMRGLDFGFVSTTLLGQVDASVGGKNGVNVDGYKNMAGTFSQRRFVICDPGMLRTLSGREHRVHTGVCICRGRRAAATVETTVVHFSSIAEDDLCAYVRTPEPYDKAGAYAIQGHAALWCAGIEGCYYNIMGLPVHRTAQLLRELT